MSVVVVGLNHRSAPLDVLERMTIAPAALSKALDGLHRGDHVSEVVVLSTCNRTEVYAVCETFHGALGEINQFLTDLSGLDRDRFAEHLFTHYDDAVVSHLFGVASGLDSAVVGETEVLGQVRRAWDAARTAKACGPHLGALFRHSLEVGKRARTETGIARGTASVSHAAVELAAEHLGGLSGRSVLVLGTGEIGVSMVTALQHAGVTDVLVANRTRQRAAALASRLGAVSVPLHELPATLERVDLLLTATSADQFVLHSDDLESVMAAREGRPLVVVDAAMPRDVEPAASRVDGVTLLDLDSIRRFVEAGLEERRREIDRVNEIVSEEANRYAAGASARQVAPVIRSLREHLESLRLAEIARVAGRASDSERELIDQVTRQLLAKVLHDPTVALKASAGTVRGQRMTDAVRSLFGLGDGVEAVEAVDSVEQDASVASVETAATADPQ